MSVRELREKQQKLVADARECLDQISDADEARASELEARHDKAMAEYDRLESQIQRQQRVDEAEARMNAPDPRRPSNGGSVPGGEPEQPVTHAEAFDAYMRQDMFDLSPEYREALKRFRNEERQQGTSSGSAGGYLVPEGFQAELMVSLQATGPMLDPGVTREIVTSSGNEIMWPTMDDTSNEGTLLGENTQDSDVDIAFGQKSLSSFKYTSRIIRVSEELLQDSAFDVGGIVARAAGERIGRIVNRHLTTGSGSGQPTGIVTASGEGYEAASAAITFDDLIELFHSVDPAYRGDPSVRWMLHDTTLKALRKIKDQNDNYIWQPANVATGQPATILDRPYSINQAMEEIGAGNKSVLFGMFSRYVVRRVRDFALRRLVERYADYYQVGFIGFGRYDGVLADAGAVKHLAHAASS